jgi:hypothetical protein
VYLLSNTLGGRANLLDAVVKVGDMVFKERTLGMLTARKGPNLEQEKQQQVPRSAGRAFKHALDRCWDGEGGDRACRAGH